MKDLEVMEFNPQGIWKIVDVYPEKNSHRLGRYVTFPWTLVSKTSIAQWIYVSYISKEEKGGQLCSTSLIETLQYMEECKQLQVSTRNSQYVFERVM